MKPFGGHFPPDSVLCTMSGEPSEAEVRRDLDTMVERLKLKRWTPEERSDYMAEQDEHPMFMDALPEVRAPRFHPLAGIQIIIEYS